MAKNPRRRKMDTKEPQPYRDTEGSERRGDKQALVVAIADAPGDSTQWMLKPLRALSKELYLAGRIQLNCPSQRLRVSGGNVAYFDDFGEKVEEKGIAGSLQNGVPEAFHLTFISWVILLPPHWRTQCRLYRLLQTLRRRHPLPPPRLLLRLWPVQSYSGNHTP